MLVVEDPGATGGIRDVDASGGADMEMCDESRKRPTELCHLAWRAVIGNGVASKSRSGVAVAR